MHPLAWWAWALGLAAAVTRAPPAFVAVVLAAVVVVVLTRRDGSPWARSFPAYLVLGAVIVLMRVAFHAVVGIKTPGPVLWELPRVSLPEWAVGVELGGPLTTTGLASAAAEGLRLATLVVCFGAANALANPKRALRCLPAALHQLGTAVVIAVSVTPQLVTAAANVRRAQRLRGFEPQGLRAVRFTTVPVLTDALDRSLALAASMDSRGYGRTRSGGADRRVGVLLAAALLGAAVGSYGLLTSDRPLAGLVMLGGALAAVVGASVLAGRHLNRSRYRPERWGAQESLLLASAVGVGTLLALPGWAGVVSGAGLLTLLVAVLATSSVPALLLRGG